MSSVFQFFKLMRISSLRPTSVGSGMQILFSSLLLMAQSRSQGLLVAPITTRSLPSSAPVEAPSIRVMSSVLTFLLASSYFQPLFEARASISSIKIVAGEQNLAMSKSILTSFSDSPFHFDAKLEAVTLKNVVLPEEAIALASRVLPVPGGPNRSTPFQARLMPLNRCGAARGSKTAYSSTSLAFCSQAMSSNEILGLKSTTYLSSILIRSASGPLPSGKQCFRQLFFYYSPGFFLLLALANQGLLQSLLSELLSAPTKLLFLVVFPEPEGLDCWGCGWQDFLTAGLTGFLGQIQASLSSNYFYRCILSLSYLSYRLYFYLRSQASSWSYIFIWKGYRPQGSLGFLSKGSSVTL